ncbi:T9SS type A sorting domain-containing protein [Pontibacter lucknowensis]|uniref:Por secretion system C-terminal sorting domain-containing protein n=1 Tax=Pontibacter lucknowensis TaxID=1077936 RepID=A0A1N6TPS5_9BACT|nr:T9SS type A sorting domain-containing protein [Pontibacter lucknowensis]SIQ55264.1 Por secretion system C-terminal sorting domain-containing protein [Pontibacter lucknowensis]
MENLDNYTGRAKDAHSMNKLLGLWRYAMVLVAFFMFMLNSVYGQKTPPNPGIGATVAGFEVDGDFKPGEHKIFPNIANGQDWQSVIKCGPNQFKYDFVNRSLWIQDGNSGSASLVPETDIFGGTSNKNGDHIGEGQSPYTIASKSGGPQKNDITNVYLHTKEFENPETGKLETWLFFGAETRSTDGTSYLDFEYNQAGVEIKDGKLVGAGEYGGRTAKNGTSGDFILIVNYSGGGSRPTIAAREWLQDGGGSWSAERNISTKGAYVVINTIDVGTLCPNSGFASNGAASNTTAALQFMEGAINLSELGLVDDPCDPEATMTVKTRSSDSFTAELKDLTFGKFQVVPTPVAVVNNIAPLCIDPSGTTVFNVSGTYSNGTPKWTVTGGTLIDPKYNADGTATAQVSVEGSNEATVTLTTNPLVAGCDPTTNSKKAVVNPLPGAEATGGKLTCTVLSVQLKSKATRAGVGAVTYLWTGPGITTENKNEQNPTVSVAGDYKVVITETANGCTSEATAKVDEDIAKPGAEATGGKLTCTVLSVQLKSKATRAGVGAVTYLWTGPGITTENKNEQNPTVSVAGDYKVVITETANGCTSEATAKVDEDIAKPIAKAVGGALDCVTGKVTLNGSGSSEGSNFTYLWATLDGNIVSGEETLYPVVDKVGTYILTVTNTDNGCTETAQASVTPAVNCGVAEGCTPGYWKNRKNSWNTVTYVNQQGNTVTMDVKACVQVAAGITIKGELANAAFHTVFGLNKTVVNDRLGLAKKETLTLIQALNLGDGSGFTQLGRAGTAALLNSCAFNNYALGADPAITSASIILAVRAEFNENDRAGALDLAAQYDDYNNNSLCLLNNSSLSSSSVSTLQGLDLAEVNQLRAYPTPFTDKAVIEFTVAQDENFSMRLYDMRGALVRELRSGEAKAGMVNTVEVDGGGLPEGLYIARMVSDSGTKTVKLLKKE